MEHKETTDEYDRNRIENSTVSSHRSKKRYKKNNYFSDEEDFSE